jgi:hypothetical protein
VGRRGNKKEWRKGGKKKEINKKEGHLSTAETAPR